MIIEEELNQVRTEQQEEWEMAKHNLKMAKKTLSQESLSRSDYTIRWWVAICLSLSMSTFQFDAEQQQ